MEVVTRNEQEWKSGKSILPHIAAYYCAAFAVWDILAYVFILRIMKQSMVKSLIS